MSDLTSTEILAEYDRLSEWRDRYKVETRNGAYVLPPPWIGELLELLRKGAMEALFREAKNRR